MLPVLLVVVAVAECTAGLRDALWLTTHRTEAPEAVKWTADVADVGLILPHHGPLEKGDDDCAKSDHGSHINSTGSTNFTVPTVE